METSCLGDKAVSQVRVQLPLAFGLYHALCRLMERTGSGLGQGLTAINGESLLVIGTTGSGLRPIWGKMMLD